MLKLLNISCPQLLFLTSILFSPICVAQSQGSAYVTLDFGGSISIGVPRNWTYKNEEMRRHINTAGEAYLRLAGIPPNPGENVILVSGTAYISQAPVAQLRLSVRNGSTASQADTFELSKLPSSVIQQAIEPIISDGHKATVDAGIAKQIRTVNLGIVNNKSLICVFSESEADGPIGNMMMQTYICPMGSKTIKLSTSYRKSEVALFAPVTKYVWLSLKAK